MTIRRLLPLLVSAAFAATACDAEEAGARRCADGSLPLETSGRCEFAGDAGEPCAGDWDCAEDTVCHEGAFCVGAGALRVTLSFHADSDFDLHVRTPSGASISFERVAADGGILDVDQCISPCGDGTHVENVVFGQNAPIGVYTVHVKNYDGRAGGRFRLEVDGPAASAEFAGRLPAEEGAISELFTFEVVAPVP